MYRKAVVILLLILSGSPFVHAQQLRVSVNPDSMKAGQLFDLRLNVPFDKAYSEVIYPDSTFFPESIGWNSIQRFRKSDFADSAVIKLQFFAINDITLPPLPVTLISDSDTTVLYSEQITLAFKPSLGEDEAELKPLKTIFPFSRLIWPYILALLILVAIAAWIWYRYFNSETPEVEPEPQIRQEFKDPLKNLETTLKQIKKDHDPSKTGDFKIFYAEIGDAVRQYYEDLYEIPALESTSRELFRYLDAFGVDTELISYTRQILSRADMVKFAKYIPSIESAMNLHLMANQFTEHARSVDSARVERLKRSFMEEYHIPTDADTVASSVNNEPNEEGTL